MTITATTDSDNRAWLLELLGPQRLAELLAPTGTWPAEADERINRFVAEMTPEMGAVLTHIGPDGHISDPDSFQATLGRLTALAAA